MSVVDSLIAFGLRQVVGDATDLLTDSSGQIVGVIRKIFTDHSKALPNALARANDRAWQAVGLALAGAGLFDRIKGSSSATVTSRVSATRSSNSSPRRRPAWSRPTPSCG